MLSGRNSETYATHFNNRLSFIENGRRFRFVIRITSNKHLRTISGSSKTNMSTSSYESFGFRTFLICLKALGEKFGICAPNSENRISLIENGRSSRCEAQIIRNKLLRTLLVSPEMNVGTSSDEVFGFCISFNLFESS